jgi:hypothetical protein
MSFAGFKLTGPACCCCPEYFVHTNDSGSTAPEHYDGWRGMRMSGEYPDNKIKFDDEPSTPPNGSKVMTVDFRNKKLFVYSVMSSTVSGIHEFDFKLKNRREVITFPRAGTTFNIACDWQRQCIYYGLLTVIPTTSPWTYTQEIRKVNYDGTGDTLIKSETYTQSLNAGTGSTTGGNAGGPVWFAVDVTAGNLYYGLVKWVSYTTGGGGTDNNVHMFIKRIGVDGTGEVTLVSREDTTHAFGDSGIYGLGVIPELEKTFWIESDYTLTRMLKVADLDCAGESTILTTNVSSLVSEWRPISNCTPNHREGRIYFEDLYRGGTDVGDNVFGFYRIDLDGGNEAKLFDDTQDGWYVAEDDRNYSLGQTLRTAFTCKTEDTGDKYSGSGYLTGR